MISTNTELRFRRGQITYQMARVLDSPLTPESRAKFDLLDTEQKQIRAKLDSIERQERLDREVGARYRTAWGNYIRHGYGPSDHGGGIGAETREILSRGESRDMGTGGQGAFPGSTSGFFVPVGFENQVESALKF